jgi:hypothetical protein
MTTQTQSFQDWSKDVAALRGPDAREVSASLRSHFYGQGWTAERFVSTLSTPGERGALIQKLEALIDEVDKLYKDSPPRLVKS